MGVLFDGTNHINVGTGVNFNAAADEGSIMAWFRLDTNAGQDPRVVCKGTTSAANGQVISLSLVGGAGASKLPRFRVMIGGSTTTVVGVTSIQLGRWHHIAGTREETGTPGSDFNRVYLDGVLDGSVQQLGGLTANNATMLIGQQPGTLDRPFQGVIADVRVYSRFLGAAEIQTIYAARGRDGIIAGLTNRWPLADRAPGVVVTGAVRAADIATGGQTGTGSGSPTFAEDVLSGNRRRRKPPVGVSL